MAELTKEWLQQTIAELEEERDAVPGVVNEDAARALAAMKRALASLEAEAIGFAFADDLDLMRKKKNRRNAHCSSSWRNCCIHRPASAGICVW